MYRLLIILMSIAALQEFGMSLSTLKCRSRSCSQKLETLSRDVLRIDWKPISVWPEEAKRFQ